MLGHPQEHTPFPLPPGADIPTVADTPWEQTAPQEQTPPRSRHPPPPVQSMLGRYGQCIGSMHPTAMQSCLYLKMLVNVKLDCQVKGDYLSRLQTLLVILILNGMAKTKLTVLPFLCCGEIVKNSITLYTLYTSSQTSAIVRIKVLDKPASIELRN